MDDYPPTIPAEIVRLGKEGTDQLMEWIDQEGLAVYHVILFNHFFRAYILDCLMYPENYADQYNVFMATMLGSFQLGRDSVRNELEGSSLSFIFSLFWDWMRRQLRLTRRLSDV